MNKGLKSLYGLGREEGPRDSNHGNERKLCKSGLIEMFPLFWGETFARMRIWIKCTGVGQQEDAAARLRKLCKREGYVALLVCFLFRLFREQPMRGSQNLEGSLVSSL
jgi:hypothetical protein